MDDRAAATVAVATADPGGAPAIEDTSGATQKPRRPPATSRVLWLGTYALVVVFMVLRLPQLYRHLRERIPPEMSAGINDVEMEALALKIGVFLALVLTAAITGIYFSLAAVLEKKIFTARRAVRGEVTFGLFYLVIALCMLPQQVASVTLNILDPRDSVLYYAFIAAVGSLSPWVYRSRWRGLPARKIAILFAASLGLAGLTLIG